MSLFLLAVSFLAGMLTILAPCVLPVLPVIIGSSASSEDRSRPIIVTLSLSGSIILFTLILKASALLIDIPQVFWTAIAGGIVFLFGLTLFFPHYWETIALKLGLSTSSGKLLAGATKKESIWGSIAIGAALGPVFASCSPTYFVILATVLPSNFIVGVIYLFSYGAGLALVLGLIAYFGQGLVIRLGWLANPNGLFKRIMGLLMILVGLSVITGFEKKIETFILDAGFGVTGIEERLLERTEDMQEVEEKEADPLSISKLPKLYPAPELNGLTNWINSEVVSSMSELEGKVVMIDFWTYSCINCIRTLPYLQSWHERYADDGLVIIGVHAPEFQFEKKLENVQDAVIEFGLTYPVVQDNDFQLWRAYNNRYWPAKYLIDQMGNVRYTHFGEGEYDETEEVIIDLLDTDMESAEVSAESANFRKIGTRETYIGLDRRKNYVKPSSDLDENEWTLTGDWEADGEQATNTSIDASIKINFTAAKAKLVIDGIGTAQVFIDGELATEDNAGQDVQDGILTINGARLYSIADFGKKYDTHELEIIFQDTGIELFAWTFG